MSNINFSSPLEASSYHHPSGGSPAWQELRRNIVSKAISMGYDESTMLEHGVYWADDQDPFGHVMAAAYPRLGAASGVRMFESFEAQLKDKYKDLSSAKGVGVIAKSFEIDIMRPVSYPDSIIVAVRLGEVQSDRYLSITSMWSLKQQAMVAQTRGYVVFFDYLKARPVNLVEAGLVYANLHAALVERANKSHELASQWERENPSETRGKKDRL